MYSRNYGIDSDGDLYRMQQEAIKRAREMAQLANTNKPPDRQESPEADGRDEYGSYEPPRTDNLPEHVPTFARVPEAAAVPEHENLPQIKQVPETKVASRKGIFSDFLSGGSLSGIFKRLKTEDILLIIILFILIADDSDDDIILIVAFLLFSGLN